MIPSPQLLNQVASFIQAKGKFSYYCLFLLGKEAGLRISEAVKFDLSTKNKQGLYRIEKPKGKNERFVYVSSSVVRELKRNNWQLTKLIASIFTAFYGKLKES